MYFPARLENTGGRGCWRISLKQFMSEKMFPTQMVFVGLENRGVYEAGIRFKGTPEGDGSLTGWIP